MSAPTIEQMILKSLREMGADGLVRPGECGCRLDDLMPCGDGRNDCVAGRDTGPGVLDGEGYDFIMVPINTTENGD